MMFLIRRNLVGIVITVYCLRNVWGSWSLRWCIYRNKTGQNRGAAIGELRSFWKMKVRWWDPLTWPCHFHIIKLAHSLTHSLTNHLRHLHSDPKRHCFDSRSQSNHTKIFSPSAAPNPRLHRAMRGFPGEG